MTAHRVTPIDSDIQLPVTLEEVKAHLKITVDDEDQILRGYLNAAFAWAEEHTRRAISTHKFLVVRDTFPFGVWELPLGRIQMIDRVDYIDVNGATVQWTASPVPWETDFDTNYRPRFRPKPAETWPSTGNFMGAARVQVTAGWAQDDIPMTVRQAILLKVAEFEQSRGPGDETDDFIGTAAEFMVSNWSLPPWQ